MLARFAILLLALAAAPLRAGIPPGYADVDRSPPQLAHEVFDAPYGRLLVGEFGGILRDSADAECLRSRAITVAAVEARGLDLLVSIATRYLQIAADLVDEAKFEVAIARRAGKDVKAELAALRADSDIARYFELNKLAVFAGVANQVAENIDRHALLRRIPLKRRLSPLGSGNSTLLQAFEDLDQEAGRFLDSRTSPGFKRLVEIQDAMAESLEEASDKETFLRMGPVQLTPELEARLAELCVLAKR